MARTTLADVARHVGVSAKTVSNVVNGTGTVGPEVRARVNQALIELDYRPNLAARHLRGGRSGVIALAIPDLSSPYFAELASYFVTAAQQRGITVLVNQTGGDRDVERRIATGDSLPALDALVLSPLSLLPEDLEKRRHGTPLVLLGEHAASLQDEAVFHVGMANIEAARLAVNHLIERGHRRIAAIGIQVSGSTATSDLRAQGYREALAHAGIPHDPALEREAATLNTLDGTTAVQALIDSGTEFDALFCFTDWLAIGALHALALNRIRVPEDVAVIAFDNIDDSEYSVPPLSTVGPSPRGIATAVFDLLDHIGRNGAQNPEPVIIQPELVIRAST